MFAQKVGFCTCNGWNWEAHSFDISLDNIPANSIPWLTKKQVRITFDFTYVATHYFEVT